MGWWGRVGRFISFRARGAHIKEALPHSAHSPCGGPSRFHNGPLAVSLGVRPDVHAEGQEQ